MQDLDIFYAYATDKKKEKEGVWHNLRGSKAKILVARANSRAFQQALDEGYAREKAVLDAGGEAADEVAKRIYTEAIAEHLLLGWDGVKFKKAPTPYSKEAAAKLLEIDDFRAEVLRLANEVEHYRYTEEEEAVKN